MTALRFRRILLLACAAVLATCTDPEILTQPHTPEPGDLAIELAGPQDEVGALLLRLTGPSLPSGFNASQPGLLRSHTSQGEAHVAIFGELARGPVASFAVPDVHRAAEYRITLLEIADLANSLVSTAQYGVALRVGD